MNTSRSLKAPLPAQVVGLFLAILTAGGASSWFLQRHLSAQLVDQALRSQQLQVETDVTQFDATLQEAERSIGQFAALISGIDPDSPASLQAATTLEQQLHRDPDGAWRSRIDRFEPQRQAGIWLPPSVSLTASTRAFFGVAQPITSLFGLGVSSLVLENTWVLPLRGGELIFWPSKPDFIRQAAADLDYRPTPWVQLTSPQRNPAGQPRWTQPDYDPAARDWLISVVAPFHQHGRWAGSVGHDLLMKDLLRWLIPIHAASRSELLTEPLYLVDGDGRLLVHAATGVRPEARLPERHRKVLQPAPAGARVFTLNLGDDHLIVARLPRLEARAVYRVNVGAIQRLVSRELSGLQLGVTLFMALLLSLGLLLVSREMAFRRREQQLLEERNRDLEQVVQARTCELAAANAKLAAQAAQDGLTGVGNRRCLEDQLHQAWANARRRREPLALVMLDVDHFKIYNDTFGHPAGDGCLRDVAAVLRESLHRPQDGVFRYGGEEFVLLLPNTNAHGALHCAEQLRAAVEHRALPHPEGVVTISLGVATALPFSSADLDGPGAEDVEADSPAALLSRADVALYRAKQQGRNRVQGA